MFVVLVLAGLCLLALAPAIFMGRVPAQTDWLLNYGPWGTMPWTPHSSKVFNPGNGDDFVVYLPDRIAALNQWRSGRIPLWNPYVSGGVSFLGMQTSNPLDPLIILELLFPLGFAMGLEYALLLFLAGLGVALLLRDHGIKEAVPLAVAGVAFALSPYFVTWLENRVFLAGLADLPLALWAGDRIITRARARTESAILAFCLGYALLGGTLQTFAIVVLLLTVRITWVLLSPGIGGSAEWHGSARHLPRLGAAFAAGVAIGILPLIAGIETLSQSTRMGSGGYYAGRNFLGWRAAALWFNLHVFSLPDAEFAAFKDLGRRFMFGSGWGAAGIVPGLLAVFALCRRSGPARERIFWGGIGGLTLAFLLLQATPFHAALVKVFPWLDDVDLLRGLVVVSLAAAVLAGWGAVELLALWQNASRRLKWLIPCFLYLVAGMAAIALCRFGLKPAMSLPLAVLPLLVLMAAVAVIGFLPFRGRRGLAIPAMLLLGLVVAELSAFHFRINTFSSPDLTYPADPMTDTMQKILDDPDHPRYVLRAPLRLLPPNTGSVYGLPDIRGYSNIPIARYRLLLECAEGRTDLRNNPDLKNFASPVYDLLGAKILLAHAPPDSSYGSLWKWGIFLRPRYCPRAFLVHRLTVVHGEREMRERICAPDFDPLREVLLEDNSPPGSVSAPTRSELVRITSLEPDQVSLRVEAAAPGILVLADPFFPGWKATVDRVPAKILPAYWGLRGIAVSEGAHDVRFSYRPDWLLPGAILTAAGLLFAGFLLVRSRIGTPERSSGRMRSGGKRAKSTEKSRNIAPPPPRAGRRPH